MSPTFNIFPTDSSIRRTIWQTRWSDKFQRILVFGCIPIADLLWIAKEYQNTIIVWLIPNGPKRRIFIPENMKNQIKLIVNVPLAKFQGRSKFDLVFWNGSHSWDDITNEFFELTKYTTRNTQWIANHVAPHRNWGKYPYGYLRHGVENGWAQIDAFYEESTNREVYDDAWVWFHLTSRPPTPGSTLCPKSHLEPAKRIKTVGEQWEKQERLVWITDWTARVEKAQTIEEMETLQTELEAIRATAPTHGEDAWSRRVWREKCEQLQFQCD